MCPNDGKSFCSRKELPSSPAIVLVTSNEGLGPPQFLKGTNFGWNVAANYVTTYYKAYSSHIGVGIGDLFLSGAFYEPPAYPQMLLVAFMSQTLALDSEEEKKQV